MAQKIFWINIGLFLLLPLLIALFLLSTDPVMTAGTVAVATAEREISADWSKSAVHAAGGIEIIALDSQIPRAADRQEAGAEVVLYGKIGYFNGKTNLRGQTFAAQPHRFLAGEEIHIDMYFDFEPREINVKINGLERRLAGVPGRRYYWTSFILPAWPATLDWDGSRLLAPYQLQVTAVSRSDPDHTAMAVIDDIELTGSVWSIVHVQAN